MKSQKKNKCAVILFLLGIYSLANVWPISYLFGSIAYAQNPTIRLEDILSIDWNKDISEISKSIPEGKIKRFNNNKINLYSINAILSETNTPVSVSFQKNETNSGEFVTHRSIALHATAETSMDDLINQFIAILQTYKRRVINYGQSEHMDLTLSLEDPDKNGGYQFYIRKLAKNSKVHIDITRYQIISKQ